MIATKKIANTKDEMVSKNSKHIIICEAKGAQI